jgi:hypothetical protein
VEVGVNEESTAVVGRGIVKLAHDLRNATQFVVFATAFDRSLLGADGRFFLNFTPRMLGLARPFVRSSQPVPSYPVYGTFAYHNRGMRDKPQRI